MTITARKTASEKEDHLHRVAGGERGVPARRAEGETPSGRPARCRRYSVNSAKPVVGEPVRKGIKDIIHRLSPRTVTDRGSPLISIGLKSNSASGVTRSTFAALPPCAVAFAAFGCRPTLRRARLRFFNSPPLTFFSLLIEAFFNFLQSAQRKLPNYPIAKLQNPHSTTHSRIRRSSEAGASASSTTSPS
jgi:hypothetical protein